MFDVFSLVRRFLVPAPGPRRTPRTDALMNDYYHGLEFLKASTDVYKTVFPWLGLSVWNFLLRFSFARSARYALTSNFAITYIR